MRTVLVAAAVIGVWLVLCPALNPEDLSAAVSSAARNLSAHRYDAALASANRALQQSPNSSAALLLAGHAAAEIADFDLSDAMLSRVPPASRHAVSAKLRQGTNLLARGRVDEAERHFRDVLQRDPSNLEAHRRLAFLLQAEGRVQESVPFLAQLLFRGDFSGNELFMVSSPERYFRLDPALQDLRNADPPADALIELGRLRFDLIESRDEGARAVLEELVRRYPRLAEPRARLGRLIVDAGDRDQFLRWNNSVTPEHEQHPEIWMVRGLQARREGRLPEAVRCFLETLIRSPHYAGANHQISGCLLQLGQTDRAAEFSALVPVLFRLDQQLNLLQETPDSANFRAVTELLQQLGRHWEAAGWAHIAKRIPGTDVWTRRVLETEIPLLDVSEGLIARDAQPALRLNAANFALPDWPPASDLPEGTPPSGSHDRLSQWRFSDDAASAGIDFTYVDGTTKRDRMRHVIETLGGGEGVIDFEGDGWPDLYVAQGTFWRAAEPESRPLDRLYRSTGRGTFDDVTAVAGLSEEFMSHGVSIGDFDSDGMPDVYVTNLGPNSLFHNNGDGTFSNWSATAGIDGNDWSASAAIVDLSGDGLPDVFVVNYLDREYVINHPCERDGLEIGCTPDGLPPARNRLYRNSGNGTFEDISESSGVSSATGNGLGLIVADFHSEQRLSVFVGNDSTPNFLFRNTNALDPAEFSLEQQGVVAGVAFNGNGSAIASMGIAAGDANGDGRLDLFVTTYMNDPDTLFLQHESGVFLDETRRARLHLPTANVLGFGSQFIDVDNDGWEDLVATNGHVIPPPPDGADDERDLMPSQVLANLGDGTFAEVSAETLGPFFHFRGLGRGLAELDWNRDGRQDFCVSYIHSPLTLLSNQTPAQNHRLVIRLIGTQSNRDAFGTVATVRAGNRTLMRQLAASGGYLVSNERRLWFGLGRSPVADELVVTWQSGRVQRFENLAADQEIVLVEGRDRPLTARSFATP
ncbi:MAG: FG-GAP-like repeat-containing protein [Planctomycetaceae bacterium]